MAHCEEVWQVLARSDLLEEHLFEGEFDVAAGHDVARGVVAVDGLRERESISPVVGQGEVELTFGP